MKFEKLNKNYTKNIIIGLIVVIIIGSVLVLNITKAKYRTTTSINIVNGTVNYSLADFNLIALYKQKVNEEGKPQAGFDKINNISELGDDAIYTIDEEQSKCYASGSELIDGDKVNISVTEDKTSLSFTNVKMQGTKCNVYFAATEKPKTQTPDEMLASLKRTTCDDSANFSALDTTSHLKDNKSCLYSSLDDDGTSYYFRGVVNDNWVKFGKTGTASGSGTDIWWRIIRINGDGSIRMIYAGTSKTNGSAPTVGGKSSLINSNNSYQYNSNKKNDNDSKYDESNAKKQIDSWFSSNLNDEWNNGNGQIETNGKFCNDMSGTSSAHGPLTRLVTNKNPSFKCPSGGIVITVPAAIITADEVAFAGNVHPQNNTSFYLNPGEDGYYWTMSPFNFESKYGVYVSVVDAYGYFNIYTVDSLYGLRPVINLKSTTQFTGNGTTSEPYIVQT